MNTITKDPLKLIKNIILIAASMLIFSNGNALVVKGQMQNPKGEKITLRFALSKSEHTKGLSGLKSAEFKETEGMLFVNKEMDQRKFWMPDTYFNLDIIFLDQNLKIVGIEKDVLAHPGMNVPPEIKTTQVYMAQFILETKANSKFSKNLRTGDILKLISPLSLLEIVSGIHPEQ